MAESGLAEELKLIAGLKVKSDEPLARYTSMKIGGPADYFIEAQDDAALRQVLPLLRRHGAALCLLGNGSNVLISDRGVRGAVIRLAGIFKRVEWREDETGVWAEVGAAMPGYPVSARSGAQRLHRFGIRRGHSRYHGRRVGDECRRLWIGIRKNRRSGGRRDAGRRGGALCQDAR